jgi:hypothetical protein
MVPRNTLLAAYGIVAHDCDSAALFKLADALDRRRLGLSNGSSDRDGANSQSNGDRIVISNGWDALGNAMVWPYKPPQGKSGWDTIGDVMAWPFNSKDSGSDNGMISLPITALTSSQIEAARRGEYGGTAQSAVASIPNTSATQSPGPISGMLGKIAPGAPLTSGGTPVSKHADEVWTQAINAHNSGADGWSIINDAIAQDQSLSAADKQTLKETFAQWAQSHQPQTASDTSSQTAPQQTPL